MFTQCPDCRKTYSVTKKQLRAKKPQVFCGDCKKKFNAKTLLNEHSIALVTEAKAEYIPKPEAKQKSNLKKNSDNHKYSIDITGLLKKSSAEEPARTPVASESVPEPLPWETEKTAVTANWSIGFIVGLMLLVGQIIYFESGKWSQNPSYRQYLEQLCHWLGCRLKNYENLAEFAVLRSSFTPKTDNTIVFKVVMNNQAAFNQQLPNIKLTLLDYNEQIFSQRIFVPTEYLSHSARKLMTIAPDETVEANLIIVSPNTSIGGYNFDLTS